VGDGTIVLGGHRLNRIGLGTNRLTHTAENRSFLKASVRAGLNFIDTAHLYSGGESETTIGVALATFPDDLVVATKGGYHPGGGIEGLRTELRTVGGADRGCPERIQPLGADAR
jgi:aryl-alcohol dehydrogenase-like predicted oxidoreductase